MYSLYIYFLYSPWLRKVETSDDTGNPEEIPESNRSVVPATGTDGSSSLGFILYILNMDNLQCGFPSIAVSIFVG